MTDKDDEMCLPLRSVIGLCKLDAITQAIPTPAYHLHITLPKVCVLLADSTSTNFCWVKQRPWRKAPAPETEICRLRGALGTVLW